MDPACESPVPAVTISEPVAEIALSSSTLVPASISMAVGEVTLPDRLMAPDACSATPISATSAEPLTRIRAESFTRMEEAVTEIPAGASSSPTATSARVGADSGSCPSSTMAPPAVSCSVLVCEVRVPRRKACPPTSISRDEADFKARAPNSLLWTSVGSVVRSEISRVCGSEMGSTPHCVTVFSLTMVTSTGTVS